jgi:hypothetical protein
MTPARWGLRSDSALWRDMRGEHEEMVALSDGRAGYVDAAGARFVATNEAVKAVDDPVRAESFCLARGVLFASTHGDKTVPSMMYRADSFEAKLQPLGRRLTWNRDTWISSDEKAGTLLGSCTTGVVERIAADSRIGNVEDNDGGLDLIFLAPQPDGAEYCLLRTPKEPKWRRLPACERMSYPRDGWREVYSQRRECLIEVSAEGVTRPCRAAPKSRSNSSGGGYSGGSETPRTVDVSVARQTGRFFAPSRIVVGSDSGLDEVLIDQPTIRGQLEELLRARRLGATDYQSCVPLTAVEPLFSCKVADTIKFVYVAPDGSVREELSRARKDGSELHIVLADSSLSLDGDCEGKDPTGVCVRDAGGTWRSVKPPREVAATAAKPDDRTTVLLLPTPRGELIAVSQYVEMAKVSIDFVSGAFDPAIKVSLRLHRSDGPPTLLHNVPTWLALETSAMLDPHSSASSRGPHWTWVTSDRLRYWPLQRTRGPKDDTREHCRVDFDFSGAVETACVEGELDSHGRYGLLRTASGEFRETVDAGESWKVVSSPRGLPPSTPIGCRALGCLVGPYFRHGWE